MRRKGTSVEEIAEDIAVGRVEGNVHDRLRRRPPLFPYSSASDLRVGHDIMLALIFDILSGRGRGGGERIAMERANERRTRAMK